AAAAVLLAGGTGVAVYGVQEQRVREQRSIASAAQQQEARTRAILAAPDLVVRTAPVIGGGTATVASSPSRQAAVVLVGADRNLTPDQALARVFTDAAYQKKMSLFLRYQSAIERAVTRSLKELTALQAERRQAEAETEAAQPPQTIAAGHYPGPAPDLEQPAGFLSQPPQARPTHATA
ncbi:MAG TPA: hypothetical protein VER03_13235, partial [Bryobacteraceae bacterium]|nr:hypothetical protein [Bryobacteraceae bacterium]